MTDASRPAVGIDSFSYHRYFGEVGVWEDPVPVRWSTVDFLDRAAELKVEIVSLQTLYLEDLSIDAMGKLRRQLEDRQLSAVLAWGHRTGLESGTNKKRFDEAMACLDYTVALGAPLMRLVCGDQFAWPLPVAERQERLAPLLHALATRAGELGLDLAVENHADCSMADLVLLIETVAAPNLGICLDLGNTIRVGDDVVGSARLAAPLVRMVHVKDLAVQAESVGAPWAWWPSVPLGHGDIDVAMALEAVSAAPRMLGWFVEMTNMHPDYSDEDAAVAESVAFVRQLAH
jgi:sugar phosphate isomerase/epimerase